MSLRPFGKVVPTQIYLLQIAGYECIARSLLPATGTNARKRAMRDGRHMLMKLTGADFGYDLSAWRDFLIENGKEHGYTHPFAFKKVDKAIQEAMKDKEIIETLKELEELGFPNIK